MKIPVAHDFTCPWCWIGVQQAIALKKEFPGLSFDWIGYELWPEELGWPHPGPTKADPDPNRPVTPSRMELAYAAAGMTAPTAERPRRMRIHNALQACEYAKAEGVGEAFVEKLYHAYWEEGLAISEPEVIRTLATGLIANLDDLLLAVEEKRFADKIVPFDDAAYAAGIFNVPTFIIGGERYAEQPLVVLRKAVAEAHSTVSA